MTYEFLQHYWCFLVSLLGALLVFLLFVQGANSMVRSLGYTDEGRRLIINSTGRKWEFTFTTLVTFGGAFFASFPLFYSTSFGGAYWLWMIILFTFVLQAVSYEFQNKLGNFLGPKTFQMFHLVCMVVCNLLLIQLLLVYRPPGVDDVSQYEGDDEADIEHGAERELTAARVGDGQ